MALIYSYPLVSNADIDSNDLILMSESSADSETKNISIGQLSSYMIEAGAAGSSQILDYRNLLSSYMSVEGGILVLDGFYNKSEVAGLISGKTDSSVTAALTGRVASIESTTIPPISSAINNHLTAYSTYTGITDGRLLQLEANIDSVNGAMYQMHLGTQGYLQQAKTYTNEQLGDYSTTSISQLYTDTVTNDLATNEFVRNMGSSFGSVDPTTGVVTVNEAFANTIITTSSSPRFATSLRMEEIGITAGNAAAGVGTNSQAIGNIDGTVKATYSLNVNAAGNVAGMKLGADNDSSYVSFLADRFKIYNGSTAESPFEVIGGVVKIKDGVIGNISLGQVTGAADAFQQVTTVYAEDANGTNPSTTRGTRGFVAWYTNINLWTPSAGVSELEFERIQGNQGIQGIPGNPGSPGSPGSPGTPGIPGPAGSSVTIKGTVASVNDLPSATSTIGDGYIIGNDLHVFVGGTIWNNVGVIRGPKGLQGDPGEDGIGTDGFDGKDGNDGDYVSYIYIVSETAPQAPSTYNGSFNGTEEVVPSGNWTDNPSASIDDVEWMSTRRYKNSKTLNSDGSYSETWTGGNWSQPTRIYQRGKAGNTPVKNIDFFDGKDGSFTSFIFKTTPDRTPPTPPVGGEYNGVRELFPTDPSGDWFDEPTADETDTEWVSKTRYTSTKTYNSIGEESVTWTNSGWSKPSRIYQKGDTGLRGPIGRRGADGTSVTILGQVDSYDDLPVGDNKTGDGYLIGTVLWVYSESQAQFIETGDIKGPGGENGAPGDKGDPGVDGFDGNDGIYTSFVYRVSDTLPSTPQHGSFNGAVEVYPTSDGVTWTDNPSVDDEDIEWRSTVKYRNNKYIDDDGVKQSEWTKMGDWSAPVKIYQKGLPGATGQSGNSVNIKGKKDSTDDLPNSGNQLGDCWLIDGVLFVYNGDPDFVRAGSIKGDKGDNGDTPQKFRDYYDGNDGSFTSFIFRVTSDNTAPAAPTDGSYNGSSEIIPSNWSNEPIAGDHDVQWTCTRKYSHNAQTGVWSGSNWSTPAKYIQKGDRGPIGPRGVDGTSVTIIRELNHTDDLPSSSTNPTNGDGYLIAGNLWVWNTVQDQFIDVGRIQGPPGTPGASITGAPGDTGEDGLDGDDGIYTSFVYKVQDTKPNRPTSSTGSFDGVTEVMPDSDTSTPWTDNPSVSTQDVEWRSSMKYKNTKSVNADGDKLSVWSKVTEQWSEPAKIYQKGLVGATGTSITMKGAKSSTGQLPLNTPYHTNNKGDSYMVGTVMWTWTGVIWDDVGDFEGPPGQNGTTPLKGRDYYDGNKGQLTSFIFRVSQNQPNTPSGGSYNGSVEVYPQYWTDDPGAEEDETEWVSTGKYNHDAITDTWSFGGWSTPKIWYKQGDKGDVGDRGPRGNPGIAVDGDNVRIEYATSANGPWSSVQQANSTYIRSAVQANGTGAYVGGTGTKFVPTLGVEYDNGQPGTSSYIHIKYSNNGTSFSGSNGETIGEWRGIYVDSTEADSNTFSDYKWIKTTGATGNTGANGFKTKTGLLWYSASSGTNPGQPSATSYDFTNNTIIDLSSGWSLSPPIMQPGTASNLYWTSTYNVTEQASPANTGTITFEPTTQAFGFDQVVTFNSLSTNSSTVINGNNITTGIIQSDDYVVPPAIGYAPENWGFSPSGMGIDLDDGSIHSKQFYVNSDGSAGFGGLIRLSSAATTTRGAQNIILVPNQGVIKLTHAEHVIDSDAQGNLNVAPAGRTVLDSQGIYVDNAGMRLVAGAGKDSNDYSSNRYAAAQFDGSKFQIEDTTEPQGESYIAGIYASAYNSAWEIRSRNEANFRRTDAYGAVIEDLRADGFIKKCVNAEPGTHYGIPQQVVVVFTYGNIHLYLPNQAKIGQSITVTRLAGSTNKVWDSVTDSSGNHRQIRNSEGYRDYIEVTYSEEFIFQGEYWVHLRKDNDN